MSEFIVETILGGYTLTDALGFLWFFLIGYTIYGLNETSERNKESTNTPKDWSWKFWAGDNWKRYIVTILSTYVMFRFYVEIVGHEFTNFEALMMGLIGDGIGAKAKKRVGGLRNKRKMS
ncbi:MAG: hypothetical protein ACOC1X_04085 [Promethearchaeota archaeon]